VVTGESNALDFDLAEAAPPAEAASEPLAEDLVQEIVDFDLGAVGEDAGEALVQEAPLHAGPDFSPEGTMVMSSSNPAGVSTYVGLDPLVSEEPESEKAAEPSAQLGDLDFDLDASTQTVVNPMPGAFSADAFGDMAEALPETGKEDDQHLTATVVGADPDSLEFDVKLTDSVFLGQPMMPTDFDIGSINLDLAADTTSQPVAEPVVEPAPANEEEAARGAHWEQVNTKLELAKAYEEMGDLEGARELLQEVVGEGSVDLVEQARTILGRIGE